MDAANSPEREPVGFPAGVRAPLRPVCSPLPLAGLEAGIIGGLAMLAFCILDSLWHHHPWWLIPNLLGSTFYGYRAFRMGPGMASASGIGLQLIILGFVGMIFAVLIASVPSRIRSTLLGMGAGLVWYIASQHLLFPQIGPLVAMYAPEPSTLLGYLLFGVCIGRFPYRPEPDIVPMESPSGPPSSLGGAEVPGQEPAP
ncbi:MAG TPA: hypothetical protein VKV15_23140 [Bryobacteraceae bacterium]|nr:hypothetical protein [Bryobacteraceae bacterium]